MQVRRRPPRPPPRAPQDDSNPDFVSEVVELYFEDSASKMGALGARLGETPVDFGAVDALVHQFKGSSASFGAAAMAGVCVALRETCHARDAGACSTLLDSLQACFAHLRHHLERFLNLEQRRKQLAAAGGG